MFRETAAPARKKHDRGTHTLNGNGASRHKKRKEKDCLAYLRSSFIFSIDTLLVYERKAISSALISRIYGWRSLGKGGFGSRRCYLRVQ
ncbi:hypothetical protein VTN02DRAFT_1269 [Thermoascus thermophilus]